MFREHIKNREVNVSHELSGRINVKKNESICRIDSEYCIDAKIETRYAG